MKARTVRRNGICVLTFHRVVEVCERDHDITWKSFRDLLDTVVRGGGSIETRLDSGEPLRKTAVALTFDDGTADHQQVGTELAARGMAAIFFVPAGTMGTPGRLSVPQVRDLHALGHILGSHSFSGLPLHKGMSRRRIQTELGDSKACLEDASGSDVPYFAPPGGIGHRWLSGEMEGFGYQASRSMVWGIYRSLRGRWTIPCIPVTEFTIARGWVGAALSPHPLSLAMKSAWAIKSMVPGAVRKSLRRMLHHPFQAASR